MGGGVVRLGVWAAALGGLLLLAFARAACDVHVRAVIGVPFLVELRTTFRWSVLAARKRETSTTTHEIPVRAHLGTISLEVPRGTLPFLIDHRILIQPLILLLLLNAAPLIAHLLLLLTNIPRTPNSSKHRPRPLHLLRRHQIPRTQHPNIIPPLHHILMRPRPKRPGMLAPKRPKRLQRPRLRAPLPVLPPLNMELMRARRRSGRRAQRARRQEQAKHRRRSAPARRVGRGVLVQEPSGGEDEVRLAVAPREALLALHQPGVHGDDARVLLARVHDVLRVAQGGLRVEEVVAPRGKADPFPVRGERGHVLAEGAPGVLDGGGHARLPLVECLPGGLDGADDAFFEVGAVLLHDDDGLLECVFFVDLLLELARDGGVGYVSGRGGKRGVVHGRGGGGGLRVALGCDAHRRVFEDGDVGSEFADEFCGELAFPSYASREFSRIILDILSKKNKFDFFSKPWGRKDALP